MKADKKDINRRINIIKGQLDGISKMVEEDRYCIDISTQILAVISALKSANQEILRAHLESCVRDSFQSHNEEDIEEKIDEIIGLLKKMGK